MKNLFVALMEPLYPINVGYVARIMMNFGVKRLVLIEPKFEIEEALKFASHGAPILKGASIVDKRELFSKFDLVVGTTAIPGKRPSNITRNVITPETLSVHLAKSRGKTCLLLGRDTTGLTHEELQQCDTNVHIQTGTSYGTLNVSHALSILLYAIVKTPEESFVSLASKSERTRVVNLAVELAKVAGVQDHKVRLLQSVLKRILASSLCSPREAYLLMGLFRKAASALQRIEIVTASQKQRSP